MKPSILNAKTTLAIQDEPPFLLEKIIIKPCPGWMSGKVLRWVRLFFEKLEGLFDAKFESDWEKKTSLPWREWHQWE